MDFLCHQGMFCNEDKGGCTTLQASIFEKDKIQLEGKFTFDSIYLNDGMHNSIRELDADMNTMWQVAPATRTIHDVGNGTYWTKYKTTTASVDFPGVFAIHDNVIQLRSWEDDYVLAQMYVKNLASHDLSPGNHPLEAVGVKWLKVEDNEKVNNVNGIAIFDFSVDPPTETVINPFANGDFNPEEDWGPASKKQDWMHGNTAGVDNDGNYYMNGRHGSFLVVYDKTTHQKLYTIASEFRSDYQFPDKNDHFYAAHDNHQLPNGNWLIYDNGNERPAEEGGEYTRCVEYAIDHTNKTFQKVWEYKLDGFCPMTGSCRRLPNGNTLVDFNNCVPYGFKRDVTLMHSYIMEVEPSGKLVGKATFEFDWLQVLYRAVPSKRHRLTNQLSETPIQITSYEQTKLVFGIVLMLLVFVMIIGFGLVMLSVKSESSNKITMANQPKDELLKSVY